MQIPQVDGYQSLLTKTLAKKRAEWTLDDWVVGSHFIYKGRNASKSAMEMWLHVANDASQLSEEVRKGYLEVAVREGAKMFGRICCFVGKYLYQKEFEESDPVKTLLRDRGAGCDFIGGPESFGKWILEKYPKCCGTCWEVVCHCSAYRPIMENRDINPDLYDEITKGRHKKIEDIKKRLLCRNKTEPTEDVIRFLSIPLDNMIDNFYGIYGGGHFDLDLWKIAAHLMEEVGEVANEILYLADLNQAKREGIDFVLHMKNAFFKARGDERGLEERLQLKIEQKLAEGSEQSLAYFGEFIAETMRGELADVMSWLSALLWKVGEIWRTAKIRKVGEEPQYYKFWQYLDQRFTGQMGNLACPFCEGVECEDWCRSVSLTKNVIREMNKSVKQSNIALLATLGVDF